MAAFYSNSTSIWFTFTASPGFTFTDFTLPATGEVTLVSIFIASSTIIRSLGSKVWPGCALTLNATPATGLRQTLASSTLASEGAGLGALGTGADGMVVGLM